MEKWAYILIAFSLFLLVVIIGLLSVLVYKLAKNQVLIQQQPQSPPNLQQKAELPQVEQVQLNNAELNLSSQVPTTSATEMNEIPKKKKEFHPIILERMNELKQYTSKRSDLYCPNHREEPGETVCGICDKLFCKACIKDFKALHFCKHHLTLVMNYEWDEVYTLKTSTQDPERGVRLYDLKKEIFEKEKIPSYIETHYKINVDHDHIETYLVVYAKKENIQELKLIIENDLGQ